MVRLYAIRLAELAGLLPRDRIDWQLDGGMAVAAHTGGFRRQHGDVDVGIFIDDLKAFERRLIECGFALFSRNPFHGLEYTPVDIVHRTSANEVLSSERVKRLTAIKVNRKGRPVWEPEHLTRFDVHLHERARDAVLLTRNHLPFPGDLFFGSRQELIINGCSLPVASLPFLYFFKLRSGTHRPKHRFDLRIMDTKELVSVPEKERLRTLLETDRALRVARGQPGYKPLKHIWSMMIQKGGPAPEEL
ncbi:MAG: hypothetical protein JW814_08590 [Candidatus Krumholzibacteriota bacterium]|nr:hypothetical protein [Candidatus Krumholzibacteriota bacterium]